MYNIEVFKIYLFIFLCCISYRSFLKNLVPGYPIPRFSTSFKPINGFAWEISTLTPEILIKLYGIKLISQLKKTSWINVLTHIYLLEASLLVTTGSSSFVFDSLVSIISFCILKSLKI
jgi:hypothetical protein